MILCRIVKKNPFVRLSAILQFDMSFIVDVVTGDASYVFFMICFKALLLVLFIHCITHCVFKPPEVAILIISTVVFMLNILIALFILPRQHFSHKLLRHSLYLIFFLHQH